MKSYLLKMIYQIIQNLYFLFTKEFVYQNFCFLFADEEQIYDARDFLRYFCHVCNMITIRSFHNYQKLPDTAKLTYRGQYFFSN